MNSTIIALISQSRIFLNELFRSDLLVGFILGFLFATILGGFILTINPRHVPMILRYSISECFQKIDSHDKKRYGYCSMNFDHFLKVYFAIRLTFTLVFVVAGVVLIFSMSKVG